MASFKINERSSFLYKTTLTDKNGVAVPGADLTTLLLTLYDKRSDVIINGRNRQNVLNTNGVTVNAQGQLEWNGRAADTPITGTPKKGDYEVHIALFEATWADGELNYEVEIQVKNLHRIPGS